MEYRVYHTIDLNNFFLDMSHSQLQAAENALKVAQSIFDLRMTSLMEDEKELMRNGKEFEAVKLIRERLKCGVMQAKNIVDHFSASNTEK